MRILTRYAWHTGKLSKPVKLAVVSDLHDEPYEDIIPMLDEADMLLVPGDISNRYKKTWATGTAFLTEVVKRLPTYVSMGNHEIKQDDYMAVVRDIEDTGAEMLINRYVKAGEIWLGGWYNPEAVLVDDMLDEFDALKGCKVLMAHKPDYYEKFIAGHDIDLIIAGHAHGGQVRYFGRGIYSPGQGLLPRYTRGIERANMIVSAGAGNPNHLPRFNNPNEVLMITID